MKKLVLIILATFMVLNVFSQDDVLLTIDNKDITKDEFLRIYEKNNSNNMSSDIKNAKEYIELFINFKLKVIEAEKLGYDTVSSFKEELKSYTTELAKPYFTDNEFFNSLVKQAYDRMKNEIKISFIFIEIPLKSTPSDTLKAYNEAIEIRKRLLKGENFETVAKETSDAPSVQQTGGNAGFLTSLRAPYQIENFMYNNKVGDVSLPLREVNGYYLIKIVDSRPNQGQVQVAHIMVSLPEGSTAEVEKSALEKVQLIKSKLAEGISFEDVAKEYSDDKNSGTNGGLLQMFGSGEMVEPFEIAAFKLKNIGEISEPVKTFYGWHFLKLLDKKSLETYEVLEESLKTKVTSDARNSLCSEAVINKVKADNNFKIINEITNFYTAVDTTIFVAKWQIEKAKGLNKTLFTIADQIITEQDFATYLQENQKWINPININFYVDNQYKEFIEETIKNYYSTNLEKTTPDFRYILQEYHDGILLFNLQQEVVWNKAVEDSTGLKNFYEKNKNNYIAGERIEASIYSYSDDATLKKAEKVLKKKNPKSYSDNFVCSKIDSTGVNFKLLENNKYEKGDNVTIDFIFDKLASNEIKKNQPIVVIGDEKKIINITQVIPSQPKDLDEVKGLVIADYQSELETEWIKELRAKYKVTINQKVLDTIK